MDSVLKWLVGNWEWVAFIVLFGVSVALQGKEKLKSLAYQLMLEAEKLAKEEILAGGPEKLEYVVAQLYDLLPRQARAVVGFLALFRGQNTEKFLESLAQWLYDRMRARVDKIRILPVEEGEWVDADTMVSPTP